MCTVFVYRSYRFLYKKYVPLNYTVALPNEKLGRLRMQPALPILKLSCLSEKKKKNGKYMMGREKNGEKATVESSTEEASSTGKQPMIIK